MGLFLVVYLISRSDSVHVQGSANVSSEGLLVMAGVERTVSSLTPEMNRGSSVFVQCKEVRLRLEAGTTCQIRVKLETKGQLPLAYGADGS